MLQFKLQNICIKVKQFTVILYNCRRFSTSTEWLLPGDVGVLKLFLNDVSLYILIVYTLSVNKIINKWPYSYIKTSILKLHELRVIIYTFPIKLDVI